MDMAGVANRRSQLPDALIAPDFTPEFEAVRWGAALGDSYHDMLLMDWTVFQTGIDAEDQGYSAVVVDTVSDSGVRALRSRLNIPVVGPRRSGLSHGHDARKALHRSYHVGRMVPPL
jgi:allantoin racemase